MKVAELMTGCVLSAREVDPLVRAVETMLWAGVRHLPVVRGNEVVGVLTEGGALAYRASRLPDQQQALVSEVMKHPAEVTSPDDDVTAAAARMVAKHIGCLPVVRDGSLVGILTRSDLLTRSVAGPPVVGPGGLLVSNAMTAHPVVIHVDDDLLEAAALMVANGIRHLPVVNGEDQIMGIISDRDVRVAIGDLRRALDDNAVRRGIEVLKVREAMMTPALTVGPEESLSSAVRYFVDRRVEALPVVDQQQRPIGMLSYVDVLRTLDQRTRAMER